MKNWYALNNQGAIEFLGRASDFGSATELPAADHAIWIVNEVDLGEWSHQIEAAKAEAAKAEAAKAEAEGNALIEFRAVVIDEEFCYRFHFLTGTAGDTEADIRATLADLGLHLVEYIRWDGVDPMQKDIDALVGWASARGADWKEDLAYAWTTGNWQKVGAGDGTAAKLQRLRNTPGYGPGSEFLRNLDVSTHGY